MSVDSSNWTDTHLPCPKCGSSDALSTNDKGWSHCFSCGVNLRLDKPTDVVYTNTSSKDNLSYSIHNSCSIDNLSYQSTIGKPLMAITKEFFPLRSITKETFRSFNCLTRVMDNGEPIALEFPYGSQATKVRSLKAKEFHWEGKPKEETELFGQSKFSPGCAESITITEGEMDALSVYQMTGSKWPTVSVRSASSAKKDCEQAFKFLNSFNKIYLAFDNDEPGQKACVEVAKLFDVNKVYHVQFGAGFKDANDYLTQGKQAEFNRVWWNAKKFLPKGIINSYEDIDRILRTTKAGSLADYPFPTLQEMTYGIREGELILFTAQEKVGKQLSLDTVLPTPTGWTTIADLKVGDHLFSKDGEVTSVTFITKTQKRPYYKVTFSDKSYLKAADDHRWTVRDLNNNVFVTTTLDLFNTEGGIIAKGSKAKYAVPNIKPIELPTQPVGIHPYLLGIWLADGHSYSANITLSDEKLTRCSKFKIVHKETNSPNSWTVRFDDLTHHQLDEYDLLKNKHIPDVYLRGSIEQRKELFEGLMFDGWVGDNGKQQNEYYSSNKELFDQVVELARSLGYIVSVRQRQGRLKGVDKKIAYSFRFRSADWKAIRSIEPIGELEGRCLTVDHPSHLFVAGDGWTLTHNTEIFRAIEYSLLKNTDYNIGLVHLEEEEKRSVQGLLSYELNTPVHLPDCQLTVDDQLEAYRKLTNRDGRLHFYTHFGSDDPETILDSIRYLVTVCHCKFIFLDHITMLVTGYEGDDERKKLDYISTRLAMMTRELNFTLFMISHVNDEGKTRGSRNISKVADLIVHLERDNEAEDFDTRNTTHLLVRGNRYAAKSGPAGYLWFDPSTYKIKEKEIEDTALAERF